MRLAPLLVLAALVLALPASAATPPTPDSFTAEQLRVELRQVRKELRKARKAKARIYRKLAAREREIARANRAWRPSVIESIKLAAIVYGQNSSTLIRKASCESHLWPWARNPSGATGLFQFLPGTWRSTPFGSFSIWSVPAQALAAGWMHRQGRGGEWVCR